MPRAHTEEEVAHIRKALLEKGRQRFVAQGLTRTTIAELSQDAGIGKGSFYRFYESKEELFLAISRLEEERFRQELMDDLAGTTKHAVLRALLESPSRRLREHPFLRLLVDPATLNELVLRLGAERMHNEQLEDRKFFLELTRGWKKLKIIRESVSDDELFAGLSGLFLIELQRELMAEQDIERSLELLRDALLARWLA